MKALILTTHTGGGHDAAAKAITDALEAKGVECRIMDCVAFAGRWVSRIVSNSYVKMVQKTPNRFGHIYRLGQIISTPRMRSPIYAANCTYAHRMRKTLDEIKPDMIVCTHLFGAQTVQHLIKHKDYSGLHCMILTDYTNWPFVEDVHPDVMCIGHKCMEQQLIDKKIPAECLYPLGIPVNPACRPCYDKQEAKRAIGLDENCREVLMVGGSMGAGNLPEAISRIIPALGENGHLSVVCGSNKLAVDQAKQMFGDNKQVTVYGRVSPLYPMMAAADVLVTKTGGLTSSEAMTVGVPIVGFHPIQGCETANMEFMEKHGMAVHARDDEELTALVRDLLQDDEKRARMIKAQHDNIDPDCAEHLA
ncbi:MAG: glycosyltransferase [Clostridia bacterium]|nr:glycosyltransferase [Clostridia bacterium]